jgi:hypothetical protein
VLGQRSGQRLAHAGDRCGGIDGQGPEAGSVLRIGEEQLVVDAGHGAHHGAVVIAHGEQVRHRVRVQMVVPNGVDRRRDHATAHIDAVHRVRIGRVLERAHRHADRRGSQVWIG